MKNLFNKINLLVILGPTATGKTKLAVKIASKFNGEIISADSRQVYKGMDIGTGKDLNEYVIKDKLIPYHLIDIKDPNDEYNVFQFQQDFESIFTSLNNNNKLAILCGGTGFYIKAVLMNFKLPQVKPNQLLRKKLELLTKKELLNQLKTINKKIIKYENLETKRRIIREIEILQNQKYNGNSKREHYQLIPKKPLILGIEFSREIIRERITLRLHQRLKQGLIEEVEMLIKNNISHNRLEQLGLEYRFISRYILGKLTKKDMIENLNIAIHQFAKRQMTFFRNIEKNGLKINWIPQGKFDLAKNILNDYNIY